MDITGIFEWNAAREPDGKRYAKVTLHEIYPDRTRTNGNGLCYLREYTERNMQSVVEMPLCCAFVDKSKREPLDHGATGFRSSDGMPLMEDSVVVGTFTDVGIETLPINGEETTVLVGKAVLYEQRYPNLINWIEERTAANMTIKGSVEFVGKNENGKKILYEEGATQEFRVPTDYLYSGYCLLNVPASDDAAILLEINQQEGGTQQMDEQTRKEINEVITNSLNGMRETETNLRAENESLKVQLNEKAKEVEELNAKIKEHETCSVAKDQEVEACKKKENEQNALTEQLRTELNKLKSDTILAQFNSKTSAYSDEQLKVAENEINAFKADPITHAVEINQILDKVDANIYRNSKPAVSNVRTDLFSGIDNPGTAETKTEFDPYKDFSR